MSDVSVSRIINDLRMWSSKLASHILSGLLRQGYTCRGGLADLATGPVIATIYGTLPFDFLKDIAPVSGMVVYPGVGIKPRVRLSLSRPKDLGRPENESWKRCPDSVSRAPT
jgi:hypothetical protein